MAQVFGEFAVSTLLFSLWLIVLFSIRLDSLSSFSLQD